MQRIGIDLVEISRLNRSLEKSVSLVERTFSEGEVETAEQMSEVRRHEFLAGRFAAKEAVLKALQLGIADAALLREIEVLARPDGSPRLSLRGSVARVALELGLSQWQVSISHDGGLAAAFVILS